jgi:hypothetical protein
MGRDKVDRTGERSCNNFGSEMIIVKCNNARDIDVYFPQYDWIARNKQYNHFKNGKISCPYEPRVFGVGYIGEGEYKVWENCKSTRAYKSWNHMLERCYSDKFHKRNPTYEDCEIDESFHNFQNFGYWDENNYYQIEGERMHLDKDILHKGNKIYSPETCIYVPQTINSLFIKRQNDRGESAIGTSPHKCGKYTVYCSLINPETGKSKSEYLGLYDTQEKGFEIYKYYKERNIKQVADYYKGQIPEKLYIALYNYEVEIDD